MHEKGNLTVSCKFNITFFFLLDWTRVGLSANSPVTDTSIVLKFLFLLLYYLRNVHLWYWEWCTNSWIDLWMIVFRVCDNNMVHNTVLSVAHMPKVHIGKRLIFLQINHDIDDRTIKIKNCSFTDALINLGYLKCFQICRLHFYSVWYVINFFWIGWWWITNLSLTLNVYN